MYTYYIKIMSCTSLLNVAFPFNLGLPFMPVQCCLCRRRAEAWNAERPGKKWCLNTLVVLCGQHNHLHFAMKINIHGKYISHMDPRLYELIFLFVQAKGLLIYSSPFWKKKTAPYRFGNCAGDHRLPQPCHPRFGLQGRVRRCCGKSFNICLGHQEPRPGCWTKNWVVVWKIFYVHPYLGKWSNLTSICFKGVVQPPTRKTWVFGGFWGGHW